MSCTSCSTGQDNGGIPKGCNNNGSCGTGGGCNKLNVFDWLGNMRLPDGQVACDVMEIRFKNSRKEFFRNVNNLSLNVGDVVAVESSPGHDIGVVSITGELVRLQMKKKNVSNESEEIKKIYRKAKQQDIDKWREAQSLEVETMYKARTLALRLGLQMKISDVEYQGDKSKAVFYYTANGRVDFRELIKVLAEEFKVRIEMRQIGARQEAARLGAIGSCGRELCCSTWLNDFRTVTTSAARYQQLSLNPLKLAGQCGKLKCCLNYELDSYLDALKEFPEIDNKKLATEKGYAFHQKTDIFKRIIWWSYTSEPDVFHALSIERTKEIFKLNAENIKPADLLEPKQYKELNEVKQPDYENVVGQDSLTRFDTRKKQHNKPKNNNQKRQPQHPKNAATEQTASGTTQTPQPKKQNPPQHKPHPNQAKPAQNPQNKPQNPQHTKNLKQPPQKNAPQGQPKPQNPQNPQHKKPVHNHKPRPKNDGGDKT
ncbi:MAG: regulatory iron-sulfur-containing complex subunit RicT [Bacteroidota bacterium]